MKKSSINKDGDGCEEIEERKRLSPAGKVLRASINIERLTKTLRENEIANAKAKSSM